MKTCKPFIIIPVLNRWEQTRTCLKRLMKGSYRDFRVIVVDHGSTDGTREGLRREFSEVIHLQGSTDLWWTGATNMGIREALRLGAHTVMLLNNDCYVETDTLRTLMLHREAANEVIIAPVQRSLQSGEIFTTRMTTCFLLGFPTLHLPGKPMYQPDKHRLLPTRIIIGGRGVLIPASVFNRVGLLNEEQLPHYGSDHDFFLRCRKQGIPLLIAGDAILDVDEETTTLATRLGRMTLASFIRSLRDRRSHRNLPELTTLFRLHYPVPGLYLLGVTLNLMRYTTIYFTARLLHILGIRQ
jgi:GT2 family glycosyltransferase